METLSPIPSQEDTSPEQAQKYERGYRLFKKAFLFFLVLFLIGTAFWSGYERGKNSSDAMMRDRSTLAPEDAIIINKKSQEKTIDFALFWKVWALLKDKYVDGGKLDARSGRDSAQDRCHRWWGETLPVASADVPNAHAARRRRRSRPAAAPRTRAGPRAEW